MNTENSYVEDVHQGRIELMQEIAKLRKLEEPEADDSYRSPLCTDTKLVKDICLSTGGPSDGFKLTFSIYEDGKKELSHGVYYRADWGTYKESALSDDEAEAVFDFYMGGYIE